MAFGLQVTTLQATRSKRAEVDPNGALAHKRKAGTLADIAEVRFALRQVGSVSQHQGRERILRVQILASSDACLPGRCSYILVEL